MKYMFPVVVLLLFSSLENVRSDGGNSVLEEEEFLKGFMAKRAAMLSVIRDLTEMDEVKRGVTLGSLLKSMHKVLRESKANLEGAQSIEGLLRDNPRAKEYLALILENTCFFSDILLRFPDYTSSALSAQVELNGLYRWSLNYISSSGSFPGSLINEPTKKLLHLAGQELSVGERDPDYVNPYKKAKTPLKRFEDPPVLPKKTKKKAKRGPKLHVEL
eukprot:TRINITY_DN6783_c0_g1_i1.p1 TRINITY_DN6783_c0_g1~~TRINITY_DN6783_c0_g1_i1.p1  ORF type:complete len:217 (+),score=63.37 TRINITY_DN6783_c0_g1_i1:31-681(+)